MRYCQTSFAGANTLSLWKVTDQFDWNTADIWALAGRTWIWRPTSNISSRPITWGAEQEVQQSRSRLFYGLWMQLSSNFHDLSLRWVSLYKWRRRIKDFMHSWEVSIRISDRGGNEFRTYRTILQLYGAGLAARPRSRTIFFCPFLQPLQYLTCLLRCYKSRVKVCPHHKENGAFQSCLTHVDLTPSWSWPL